MSKESSPQSWSKCLRFLNNRSENTRKAYISTMKRYEALHGMSVEDLVKEALDEQTNQIPTH